MDYHGDSGIREPRGPCADQNQTLHKDFECNGDISSTAANVAACSLAFAVNVAGQFAGQGVILALKLQRTDKCHPSCSCKAPMCDTACQSAQVATLRET
jgi:hypothetical protein